MDRFSELAAASSSRLRVVLPASAAQSRRREVMRPATAWRGVASQFVVVVQVLVPEGESEDALEKERLDIVDDQLGVTVIWKQSARRRMRPRRFSTSPRRVKPPLEEMTPPEKSASIRALREVVGSLRSEGRATTACPAAGTP